jgi:hypothetical protein
LDEGREHAKSLGLFDLLFPLFVEIPNSYFQTSQASVGPIISMENTTASSTPNAVEKTKKTHHSVCQDLIFRSILQKVHSEKGKPAKMLTNHPPLTICRKRESNGRHITNFERLLAKIMLSFKIILLITIDSKINFLFQYIHLEMVLKIAEHILIA